MKLYFSIFALFLFFNASNGDLCPDGYNRLDGLGNCYKLYHAKKNWNAARDICSQQGHHLVSMETPAEVNWLKEKYPRDVGWWTGGYYHPSRNWGWYKPRGRSTRITINNWAEDRPYNAGSYGCVAVNADYEWDNVDCEDKRKFVCEAKPGCSVRTLTQEHRYLVPQYPYGGVAINEGMRVECDRERGWKGSGTAACKGEEVWEAPTCRRITCEQPDPIQHQEATGFGPFKMGDTYEYRCIYGYELDEHVTLPVCTEHETWSYTNAECKPVTCDRPRISNGGYEAPNGLNYGKTVSFYCDAGYHLVGVQSTRCQANKRWEDDIPRCVETNCDTLEPLENGRISTQNRGTLAALYFCNDDYELKGENTLQCIWDEEQGMSVWDKEPPVCEKMSCPALPEITNGQYSGDMSSGGTVHFSCNRGYHLVGSESVTCTRGQWSHSSYPTCQVNTCSMIEVPHATLRVLRGGLGDGRGYAYGDIVYFACEEGYEMDGVESTVCNVDGRWTSQPPTCSPKSCPALVTPRHCSKDVTALHYGGVASFRCHPGYYIDGATISHCLQDGTWSHEPPECIACGLGTYRSENDLEVSCVPCPVRSSTVTTASHSVLQCTCETGTVGPPGGPCTATDCAPLAAPEHGSKQCSLEAQDTKECTFECSTGYKLEGSRIRKCTPNGWDGRPAVCVACPADTFKDEFSNTCVPCPLNTHTNGKTGAVQSDCICKQGYRSTITVDECLDIDECAFDNGNCSQRCINYGGGFQCSCSIPGYVLDEDGFTCIQNQTCSDLDQRPNHGYVRCETFEGENSKLCFIGCDPGYFFVSGLNNYLTCGPETTFHWSHQRFNNTARPPSCTREFYVDTSVPVSITYSVDAPFTCNNNGDQSIQDQMSEFIETLLNTANQGTGKCREGERGLCGSVNMTASCDKNGQTQVKTEFALVVRNFNPNAINPNDTSCGSNCGRSNLRSMLRRTMETRREISELLTQNPTVTQNDTEIALSPGRPVFGRLTLMCAEPGRVFTKDRLCVPCDKGYFLPNPWSPNCEPCPRGTFQRLEGQTSCTPCLEGSTTPGEGADGPAQCNVEVVQTVETTTTTTPTTAPTDGEEEIPDDEEIEEELEDDDDDDGAGN